jgi:shikimate kinase
MNAETRARILKHGVSIWLRADLETLVNRTIGRSGRPLLKDRDPTNILKELMNERYPVYAHADVIIDTGAGPPDEVVDKLIEYLEATGPPSSMFNREK